MDNQTQLRLAKEALENRDLARARRILDEIIIKEPDNSEVWEMLFLAMENPLEKCDCLKNIVRINPKDKQAIRKLHNYQASAEYRQVRAELHVKNKMQENAEKKVRHRRENLKKALSFIGYVIRDIVESGMRNRRR